MSDTIQYWILDFTYIYICIDMYVILHLVRGRVRTVTGIKLELGSRSSLCMESGLGPRPVGRGRGWVGIVPSSYQNQTQVQNRCQAVELVSGQGRVSGV